MAEHSAFNRQVVGSTPTAPTRIHLDVLLKQYFSKTFPKDLLDRYARYFPSK